MVTTKCLKPILETYITAFPWHFGATREKAKEDQTRLLLLWKLSLAVMGSLAAAQTVNPTVMSHAGVLQVMMSIWLQKHCGQT